MYRHIRTGALYRVICEAFDVSRQVPMMVFISMENGAIFTREQTKFLINFQLIGNPQNEIVPKEPHA